MFTGIVRALGTVARFHRHAGELRLTVRSAELPWCDYDVGESIAVNGACLTAIELLDEGFEADVSAATLRSTALGLLRDGSRVNLEPSLSLGERLGGHLVSGHVDFVGSVLERGREGRSLRLRIGVPEAGLRYIVPKGSVCVDGTSLTVNEVTEQSFTVNIVPHTADVTIAGSYRTGTSVNIEVDMIARYLEGLLGCYAGEDARGRISRDFLRAHGYA